ncbi:hypothetical protein AI2719V1_1860 [Enterobacter cloacae]|nr:hypothetical protein AI2705V1_2313 [Enterobacter cloacae]CAF3130548.1 hypothetical protein AI2984V2_1983 [Enterobacter cloacae]CAH3501244.1 hypothetical protein AI2705V1_2313 [Enterobacter cloacae]CAH3560234.1 hypothetical protein AI2719V1_1860 [Enterobacter cloacae]CAH5629648.1 hypothetical protein AI2984V2_1983 [Enterobacter cloacae]
MKITLRLPYGGLFYCTTFLKAHPTKYQTDNALTLSAVATVPVRFAKKKTQHYGWAS